MYLFDCLILEYMGFIYCAETSMVKWQSTQLHTPDLRRPHLTTFCLIDLGDYFNLLAPELFFLILTQPVYKM